MRNLYQEQEDDTKISKFNAALFKMQRLHEIRDKINKLNQCPLGFDELTGEVNYILLYNCCNSLLTEALSKLADKDQEKAKKMRAIIGEYIRKYPVRIRLKKNNGVKGKIIMQKENWEKIQRALQIYEELIMENLDKTGMDTPEEEEYQGY